MATKSKKFNRSIITKFIAFIVALVSVWVATSAVLNFMEQADNGNIDIELDELLTKGLNANITDSYHFKIQTDRFIDYSLSKATVLKGTNEKAYKNYTDTAKEIYINNILQTVINESNTETPYYTFALLKNGYITLNKIGNHNHDFDFNGEDHYYFIDGVGYLNVAFPAHYEDENGEVHFQYPESREAHYNYDYDDFIYNGRFVYKYNGISYFNIPSRILKNAGNADAVTEICDAYYCESITADRVEYDGYYAVTVNKELIEKADINELLKLNEQLDFDFVNSFSEFKRLAQENDENLAQYKNMYFAYIDIDSGTVISTLPGTENIGKEYDDISEIEEKLRDQIEEYASYAIIYSPDSSKEDHFNAFERIAVSDFNSFYSEYLKNKNCTYFICFDSTFEGGDDVFSAMASTYFKSYYLFKDFLSTFLICLAVFILCLIILIIKSGRKSYDDELHMMPFDSVFPDFRLIISAFIFVSSLFIFDSLFDNHFDFYDAIWSFALQVTILFMVAVVIDFVLFVARNAKNHTLFKRIFIVWVISKIFNAAKKLRQERKNQPPKYKNFMRQVLRKIVIFVILPNVVLGIADIALFYEDGIFFLILLILFVYDLIVLLKIVKNAAYIRKIFDAIHSIRMGNNDIRINPFELPNYLRSYADDLNNVNDGLKNAVENAIKEQKTKTELITNVSHDLKTPLTSIITYVDLLSRCEIKDENALKYIDILCDKSERLKKLIEDLIEASKASSGTINIEIVKMSLNELVYQVFAEYETEFEKRNLIPIIELSEKEIYVNADSKLAFRTLDNLFGNVKKYAMPGTRVYIKTFTENAKAYVTIQNISESQLNISAEELMTRFVRGDKSRNSDGNGLGLSIAESFSKLQNGELTLQINGDLFTAKVEYEISEN